MPVPTLNNESELLRRLAEGDKNSFSSLYNHYWDELYSMALALLKSPSHAEDTIQEVFIKLWLKRSILPSLQQFRPYFMAMVRNEIINSLRRDRQRLRIVSMDNIEVMKVEDIEVLNNTKEIINSIKETLSTFSPKQQQVFSMSREQGLSHEQIAEKLKISKKTVANLITLSLNEMRNCLGKKGLLVSLHFFLLKDFFKIIIFSGVSVAFYV